MSDRSQDGFGIDELLKLTGTDREARAYAFLYAAFRRTEVSANPVRDALDCLTPFISPHLNSIAGKQVNLEGVQSYLKKNFGFDIPLYAIEQLISALQGAGLVEWNKITKVHIAKQNDSNFHVAKSEIETDFDDVVAGLAAYAKSLDFPGAPPAGTWSEALIAFLKASTDGQGAKAVLAKGAIIDPNKAQFAVVGSFVRRLHAQNPDTFEKLLRIFMGVLIEDFIASVSEIRADTKTAKVSVLYDTAVLLRLLGTSGKMLKTATEELTRYLQDLGFDIYYFGGNESEIANIFNTIVFLKDTGKELEGETAQAIGAGEVSITDIRMLQNSFPERLATLNVFPAEDLERSAQDNARYQIDENEFAHYLLEQANASGRAYGAQNREHDARYLGTVMRLRRGMKTRDLMSSGYLFVTTNRFLAASSRRYLIEQRLLQPQTCAPILSVGQVATIAWLLKDHKLAPEKAGRELLSNCFAAVRPDAEWFRHFREGIEKVTGSIDEYGRNPANTLTLQAARRIAQEESFGSSALVRELNMAEILSRAETERMRILAEQESQLTEIQRKADHEREELLAAAQLEHAKISELAEKRLNEAEQVKRQEIQEAEERAARMTETMVLDARLAVGRRNARIVIWILRGAFILSFGVATGLTIYLRLTATAPTALTVLSILLGVVSLFSCFNLVGVPLVKTWFERLETRLGAWLAR